MIGSVWGKFQDEAVLGFEGVAAAEERIGYHGGALKVFVVESLLARAALNDDSKGVARGDVASQR